MKRSRLRSLVAWPWRWPLIALLGVLPFVRALSFAHAYDDHTTLVATPALHEPIFTLLGHLLRGDGAFPDASRPWMVLSAVFDHALFGASPMGTHLTSLVLYALTIGSVYGLSFAVLRSRAHAAVAALLWAVMPVHAELVVAASYREDLFATLGVCTALTWMLWPSSHEHSWARALGIAGAWVLGLGGKESALVLVLLLPWLGRALLQRDAQGRLRWAAFWARRERSLTLLFLVLGVYAMWRYGLVLQGDGVARREGWSSLHALPRFEVWACVESLLPLRVQPFYADLGEAHATFWLPFVCLLALAWRMRAQPIGKALGMLLLGALLTSPLASPLNERADRYLAFTTIGTAWLAVLGLVWLCQTRRWPMQLIALVCASLLALRTAMLVAIWSSDLSVFREATQHVPESAKAWEGLAWAERIEGDVPAAEAALMQSLMLNPTRPSARVSLALMRLLQGDQAGARVLLEGLREEGLDDTHGYARAWHCASLVDASRARVIECAETGR